MKSYTYTPFDPGVTSGWCHLSVHEGGIGIFNSGQSDHVGIGNMLRDNPALEAAAHKPEIETVFVAESFQVTPGRSPIYDSLEVIGLIKYFAALYQVPVFMYKSADHKPLVTDSVIKRAGLWVPGLPHARDAIGIGIYFLIKERGLLKECLRNETTTRSM